jgi:hypothetical protein
MNVADAHRAVTRAEEKVVEAEAALEAARGRLDDALAARGWRRYHVGAGPDTRLYSQVGGNPTPIGDVVRYELSLA